MIAIALFSLFFLALILLAVLAVIDLRIRLLPDIYVYPFGALAFAVHILTNFAYCTPADMLLGALCGSVFLLVIRYFANRAYKTDALGLGDVKLMGAAGLWLGTQHIFLALCLGAAAGILHGLIYMLHRKIAHGENTNPASLAIPAGPGFIIGIVIAGYSHFSGLLNHL